MMSSSRVSEDTPQPTISVTDGSCVLSMFWNRRQKIGISFVLLLFSRFRLLVDKYVFTSFQRTFDFQLSRQVLKKIAVTAMHRNKVKNTETKQRCRQTHRVCGGYVDRSCQHLNAEEEKNPPLARFAESSPTNWVIHGSNAASCISPPPPSPLFLWYFEGSKFNKQLHWSGVCLSGQKALVAVTTICIGTGAPKQVIVMYEYYPSSSRSSKAASFQLVGHGYK